MKILVANGPNLCALGQRDQASYGQDTLSTLERKIQVYAKSKKVKCVFFCTNSEGKLIDKLYSTGADAVILNPGALTHYSYALRDCVECLPIPVVEVHLSDIYSREDFRKIRVLDGVVKACFYGEKVGSYFKAVDFLTEKL